MSDLTTDDCALLERLAAGPRLIASYGEIFDKERLDRLVQRRLVSAAVYRQGGVIYGLTHAGRQALANCQGDE
jgi:hypothetical protein